MCVYVKAKYLSYECDDAMLYVFSSYKREFGFVIPSRDIVVDDVRVRGIGKSHVNLDHVIPDCTGPPTPVLVRCEGHRSGITRENRVQAMIQL